MNEVLLKDYLPLIVAIISSVIAYYFGRLTENKKQLDNLVEDSLKEHLAALYKELIDINFLNTDKVSYFKNLIIEISNKDDLYRLYNVEMNFYILELNKKILCNEIGDDEILLEMQKFSEKIEDEYWKRLITQTKGLKWKINQNNMHNSLSFLLNTLYNIKNFCDYLSPISIFTIILMGYDIIMERIGENLFSEDIRIFLILLSVLIIIFNLFIYFLYSLFEDKKSYKKNRLFK